MFESPSRTADLVCRPVRKNESLTSSFEYRQWRTGDEGAALGLAICRAIVKAHGGSITASNRPAGGAEFVIRLPLPKDIPQVVIE
ncbi:MAG: ATP-binding protein [Planctomycetaceae bacterium]